MNRKWRTNRGALDSVQAYPTFRDSIPPPGGGDAAAAAAAPYALANPSDLYAVYTVLHIERKASELRWSVQVHVTLHHRVIRPPKTPCNLGVPLESITSGNSGACGTPRRWGWKPLCASLHAPSCRAGSITSWRCGRWPQARRRRRRHRKATRTRRHRRAQAAEGGCGQVAVMPVSSSGVPPAVRHRTAPYRSVPPAPVCLQGRLTDTPDS